LEFAYKRVERTKTNQPCCIFAGSAADDPEVILGSPAVEVGGGHTVTFAIGTTSGSDSEIASTSFGSHIAGSGNGYGSITTSAHSQPVNLPAVLKDRMPSNLRPGTGSSSRGPPPPVPPRSPKRVNTAASTPAVSSTGQAKGDPPSLPPNALITFYWRCVDCASDCCWFGRCFDSPDLSSMIVFSFDFATTPLVSSHTSRQKLTFRVFVCLPLISILP